MSRRSVQVRRGRRDVPLRKPTYGKALALATGVLSLVGIGVSAYLAYSTLFGSQLYCVGIQGCESVSASIYAKIAGIPISVLGLASYLAILALSVARQRLSGDWPFLALLGVMSLALGGMIFSAFLTYVELFVLRAICPWCVTSAIVVTAILVVSAVEVRRELAQ